MYMPLKSLLIKGSFAHSLSVMMTGAAFAQLIGLTLMPVVSRLFDPTEYGIYGSYNAVLSVLTAAVTLQYTQAIVISKDDDEATNLFFVSLVSVFVVTSVVAVPISFAPEIIASLVNLPSPKYLVILLFSLIIVGINQTLQSWSVRQKAFKSNAISQFMRPLAVVFFWMIAGYCGFGAVGLILGSIFAEILVSINLSKVFYVTSGKLKFDVKLDNIRNNAKKYKDMPLYAATQNFMNALSQGLPVLLMGYYYGVNIAGAYAFGMRILLVPMSLVLGPLGQVLFQKASEVNNAGGDLRGLFIKTTSYLMAVAIVPCIVLFIWAPTLFEFIFGKEWIVAGEYARWMVLWVFWGFSNLPSVMFSRILRMQKNLFLYECIVLLSRMLVLVLCGLNFEALTAVIAFSVLGFILNASLITWSGCVVFKQKRFAGR